MASAGETSGDWFRSRNRIDTERHREAGTRAPKRYRKQVDDYFRRVAREAQEAAKSNAKPEVENP